MHAKTQVTFEQVERAAKCAACEGLTIEEALESIFKQDQERAYNTLRQLNPRIMSKQEVIEATLKLPELPDYIYDLLQERQGFMTGSNVISASGNGKDEDWCVIMPPYVFAEWSLGQSDQGYWETDGWSSIYCHRNGVIINILCFSSLSLYRSWYETTKIMQGMLLTQVKLGSIYNTDQIPLGQVFDTKWKRVRVFRALRDILYEPREKTPMESKEVALKYSKCVACSREAINFSCREAKETYKTTGVCERCSGIEY